MSSTFIAGIGTYISALDPAIRHCGMLAAEVVAQRTGKTLKFSGWEGDKWASGVRALLEARDVDADVESADNPQADQEESEEETSAPLPPPEPRKPTRVVLRPDAGSDSDDSLTGYATSAPSSRSASPTPSELDEIERDPTLRVGAKKIPRPVYLVQLGELVRGTGRKEAEEGQEADKIEMALACGEALVRRKQGYGVELGEYTQFS